MSKKVLSIIYFFPPLAGSGVQRPLKFIKYLKDFDYIPVVETVKNGHNFAYDKNLLKEVPECVNVYRSNSGEKLWLRNIIEKVSSLRKSKPSSESTQNQTTSSSGEEKPGLKTRIFNFIDLNLFIPDSKIRWYKHAVRDVNKILNKENIEVMYSSSYPYTVHLIALNIKKQRNIPWIADFRDPWTKNVFMTKFHSEKRKAKERVMEEEVMKYADMIIMVSDPITKMYQEMYPQYANKIKTITNGFDSEDFKNVSRTPEKKFTICYSGILTDDQSPETLIKAMDKLFADFKDAKQNVKLKFIGLVIDEYKNMLINSSLKDNLEFLPYMSHKEVIPHMANAQVNLIILADKPESQGVFSGKIFDYIGAERPILGIMPSNGVASNLINDNNIGKSYNHGEVENVYEFLKDQYEKWINNEDTNTNSIEKCSDLDRKNLTKKLAGFFDEIC